MVLQYIYNEFLQNYEDEYYVELAQNEILAIPLLIDIMLEESFDGAKRAQKIVEKISQSNPKIVYPFFDYIARCLMHKTKFIAWNTWKIIVNLLIVDADDKWNSVRKQYYDALCTDVITEFSIVCECAEKVIVSKPYEASGILEIFKNIENRTFTVLGEVSNASKDIAKEKILNFFDRTMNGE